MSYDIWLMMLMLDLFRRFTVSDLSGMCHVHLTWPRAPLFGVVVVVGSRVSTTSSMSIPRSMESMLRRKTTCSPHISKKVPTEALAGSPSDLKWPLD